MAASKSISKTAVWILMGLLILGLAGFGASNLGGTIRTIGHVGDMPVSTQSYARQLQQQIAQVEQQTGERLPFARAREIGLDQAVLQRLVATRALDNEAAQMGLSVGDENVRDQILQISSFQGLDGSFDREAYRFTLEQSGLNESEFENQLREETARQLLQGAVINGVRMPDSFANLLVSYAGEQRSFTWAVLDASNLDTPLTAASEDDLRAYHAENQDLFVLPATKSITYAWLTPDMIVDTVELDEDALQAEYDARINEFVQPERRLVERLVYLDEDSARSAAAQLEISGTTFEQLVEDRGLALGDVDMGDVSRLELDAAGEAVFGAEVGEVVGPLPSPLGPALFRVNGVLPAQTTTLEEAAPSLRETLALDRARRLIETQAQDFDDLLAGGATLEELAAETDMKLAQIDWTEESGEDIAAYEDFRAAAAALTTEDFPQIDNLEDGGIFAMRLDEELPERPEPFESARDAVSAAVEAERTEAALTQRAEGYLPQIQSGTEFAELGLTATVEKDRTRGAFVPRTPPAFMTEIFEMEPGEVRIVSGGGTVILVRLDEVAPASDNEDAARLTQIFQSTLDQSLAQDVFDIFTQNVVRRANPQIDPRAVEAVHVNFP